MSVASGEHKLQPSISSFGNPGRLVDLTRTMLAPPFTTVTTEDSSSCGSTNVLIEFTTRGQLGMVLYEIFAHKVPYDDIATNVLVTLAVLQGKHPPVPTTMPVS